MKKYLFYLITSLWIITPFARAMEVEARDEQAKVCSFCNQKAHSLPKCQNCQSVFYCGDVCQSNHARTHKIFCNLLKEVHLKNLETKRVVWQQQQKKLAENKRMEERLTKFHAPRREDILKNSAENIPNLMAFAKRHYGHEIGQKLLIVLQNLGTDFPKLLVDQSLMLKLARFARYVLEHGEGNPWTIRQHFLADSGLVKVYRALYLTPAEHKLILKRGMESRSLVNGIEPIDSLNDLSFQERVSFRVVRSLDEETADPIVSISTEPALAHLIGEMFSGVSHKPEGRMYVYEITLPKAILFNQSENTSWFEPTFIKRCGEDEYFREQWFMDPKIEQMLFFKIDPSEIQTIGTYKPRGELEMHVFYRKMHEKYPNLPPKFLSVAFIVVYLAGITEEHLAWSKEVDFLLFDQEDPVYTDY